MGRMTSPEPFPDPPEARCKRAEPELVAAARAGERGAQGELLRRYYASIHATAFRLLGNPEDAEDLAQECFVRAFRSLAFYRGTGSFEGWLRRIVVHLAQDRFRSRGPRPVAVGLSEALAARGEPHHALEGRELRIVLADALESLPADLRLALILRTREELEYEAIAAQTDVTPETARTRVMKARRMLLRWLAPYLGESAPRLGAQGERSTP
jgi:RNA polymerase sigma-70 factor (ECF subfamily)